MKSGRRSRQAADAGTADNLHDDCGEAISIEGREHGRCPSILGRLGWPRPLVGGAAQPRRVVRNMGTPSPHHAFGDPQTDEAHFRECPTRIYCIRGGGGLESGSAAGSGIIPGIIYSGKVRHRPGRVRRDLSTDLGSVNLGMVCQQDGAGGCTGRSLGFAKTPPSPSLAVAVSQGMGPI